MVGVKSLFQSHDNTTNNMSSHLIKEDDRLFFNKMIISIDVGIKNLAMCFIDSDTKRIIEWEVASVPSERQGGLLPALKEHLDRREWLRDAKTVVIERQPDRNKKMKAIEHYLHGFFCGRGLDTIVFDAKYKIPDVVGPGRKQYIKRKNTAIERAREWVTTNSLNSSWLDFFNNHKKKDDLADTVMQALAYIGQQKPAPEQKKKEIVRPRKPTPNQRDTKYSKSNLAWLWNNEDQDKLRKDKRFVKDIKRYFHSLEEFSGLLEEA